MHLLETQKKNEIDITFSVPEQKGAYQRELVLNELRGSDSRDLAKIICDMAWNDTIKLLLKNDDEKAQYECFLQEKAPDLLGRWHEIMNYRQEIIQEAEQVLNKPFTEITPQEKSQLFEKIDNKSIPLDKWHINFSNLAPDTEKVYNTPEDAFLPAAQQYISGAYQRRQIEEGNLREGFWLAIRDKQSANLLGVVSISTKIIIEEYLEKTFKGRLRSICVITDIAPIEEYKHPYLNWLVHHADVISFDLKQLIKDGILEGIYCKDLRQTVLKDASFENIYKIDNIEEIDLTPNDWHLCENEQYERFSPWATIKHYFLVLKDGFIPTKYITLEVDNSLARKENVSS